MTNFILVTLLCSRMCTPIQAEVYADKASCEIALRVANNSNKPSENVYCVPLVKTK